MEEEHDREFFPAFTSIFAESSESENENDSAAAGSGRGVHDELHEAGESVAGEGV